MSPRREEEEEKDEVEDRWRVFWTRFECGRSERTSERIGWGEAEREEVWKSEIRRLCDRMVAPQDIQ